MNMTLEQVRDRLRNAAQDPNGGPQIWSGECDDLADAIDAHLKAAKDQYTSQQIDMDDYELIPRWLDESHGDPYIESWNAMLATKGEL